MELRRGERSDPVAVAALVCGVAPLAGLLLAVPTMLFGGLGFLALGLGLGLLAAPFAVGLGVAGVVRAGKRKTSAGVASTGLVLGVLWLLLLLGFFVLAGGALLPR